MSLDISMLSDYFKSQPVLKAYLFGSYATGNENPDSDIDLLLELEKGTDLFRFIKIKLQLEKLMKKSVDLVTPDGLSPRIKVFVDKEKILVYERQSKR
jgi:uncharacterized protein